MLTRLVTDDASGAGGASYTSHRDRLLIATLAPSLIAAAAISALQACVDFSRYRGSLDLRLTLYSLTIVIPLCGAALSRLPRLARAGRQIAAAVDLSYTLTVVCFMADPGTTLSGTAVNLCLKLLATAILFPWPPVMQRLSGAATLVLYWSAIFVFGRTIEHTHQLSAPLLAAILAALGAGHVDRARRSLFQHALSLEGSEKRLRETLDAERHMVSIARETAVLDDLPTVLSRLAQLIVKTLRCDFSTILLLDDKKPDVLRCVSAHLHRGNPIAHPDFCIENWSHTDLKKALDRDDTIVFNDVDSQHLLSRELLDEFQVGRLAVASINGPEHILGVVMAGRFAQKPAFDERQIFLLRGIAAHAAISIRNAKLFQQLSASETAYRDLFERANDLIFIADERGRVDFANKAALDFFSVDAAHLGDLRWTDLLAEDERTRMQRRMQLARRRGDARRRDGSGTSGGFEVTVRTPQGGHAWFELRTCRITPPGAVPRRYHCVARDISERRRRDEETQALLERLQESNRLQDEFVANMSHELRTPLNVIIGYADLIADEKSLAINSDARSFLDRINAASRALHRMVESILEYARLDRGRMVLIPTHFSSDHLLLELLALCNDVRTSFEVDLSITQAEQIEFLTDYDRLYSVLSNLLLNALKFTPRGRVNLKLRRCGDEAEFVIRDTGIGIHPRELRHVFEPFRQADGSDTRTFGGVGLGLAIVRRNVDLLRGRIDVESEIDVGTTFVLRVPTRLERSGAEHSERREALGAA